MEITVTSKSDHSGVALFMSLDVVGSTAFKSQAVGEIESPEWLQVFEAFFREVPLIMMGQVGTAFEQEDEIPQCGVWKVIGDEIVLIAYPRTQREAELLLLAFYRTVILYDKKVFERWPLRIKGCCWAAQISRRNRAIEIREVFGGDSDGVYVDYLGPDIDTGFRLAGCVGRGQVIVSTNLVHLVSETCRGTGIRFHYIGRQVLKGVYKGRPYPLFLMSTSDLMPSTWEWEAEEDPGLAELRRDQPMAPEEICSMLDKIEQYLNRMCHAGIEKLEFLGGSEDLAG